MCFILSSQEISNTTLHSIRRVVSVMETDCVFCEVETEVVNVTQTIYSLKQIYLCHAM